MTSYKLEILLNKEELSLRTSEVILDHMQLALNEKGIAYISLSGGSTPVETYKLLSQKKIDWEKVHFFLGDERWVDSNSPLSNALMLQNTLYKKTPSAKSTFHPVPTTDLPSPEASAIAYSEILQKQFSKDIPIFDLILLGLGDDGHTASLFPGTKALKVRDELITICDGKGQKRITFTPLLLSKAKKIVFLVSGSTKQQALKRLLDPHESWERTPAKLVQPKSDILVLADESAAESL